MDSIKEIVAFFQDPKSEVRLTAVKYLAGFSHKDSEYRPFLLDRESGVVDQLKILCLDEVPIAHEAIKTLINLSTDIEKCEKLVDEQFVFVLIKFILHPEFIMADLVCMLLNNMSKSIRCCQFMLQSHMQEKELKGLFVWNLISLFCKTPLHNAKVNYDFLAPVFANISLFPEGRKFFTEKHEHFGCPLQLLSVYTEHPSLIRRGGIINLIKNCALEVSMHACILSPTGYLQDLLVRVMLPLAGPEEYTEEELDGMPDELQLLEDSKMREPDVTLRKELLDTLLIFTTTRQGREYMRAKKVYPIIREMHLSETEPKCEEAADAIAQMLLRDEAEEAVIEVEQDLQGEFDNGFGSLL